MFASWVECSTVKCPSKWGGGGEGIELALGGGWNTKAPLLSVGDQDKNLSHIPVAKSHLYGRKAALRVKSKWKYYLSWRHRNSFISMSCLMWLQPYWSPTSWVIGRKQLDFPIWQKLKIQNKTFEPLVVSEWRAVWSIETLLQTNTPPFFASLYIFTITRIVEGRDQFQTPECFLQIHFHMSPWELRLKGWIKKET